MSTPIELLEAGVRRTNLLLAMNDERQHVVRRTDLKSIWPWVRWSAERDIVELITTSRLLREHRLCMLQVLDKLDVQLRD